MKKLVLFLLLATSMDVSAGTQSGTVNYVIVRASDGLVYFTLKGGAISGSPACATIKYWMIKDESSNAGKLQYSMLLSAHASGKTVRVTGMNTCTRWGDGEDVDSIRILNP